MKFAIFGPPSSGKSTLFSVLTGGRLERGYGKQVAAVAVPDERLDAIHESSGSAKKTPIHLEFVDTVITTDRRAESNYAHIRPADAVVNVVRAFHLEGFPEPEPLSQIREVEQDFIVLDMAQIEGRLERLEKEMAKRKEERLEKERKVLLKLKEQLDKERPLRELELPEEEEVLIRGYEFLSAKPVVHVINADDSNFSYWMEEIKKLEPGKKAGYAVINAKIEEEILGLEEEEAREFLKAYGIERPAVEEFLRVSFQVLDLIVFYTTNERETRAWPVERGTTAYEAAGKIHSDIQRGFIRAEVVDWKSFVEAGSWAKLRQEGKVRLEGKDYQVRDGDVIFFRFNP